MCSATWWHNTTGYELFFNRDEKRDRARAEAPQVQTVHGVRCIAPRDPAGGGTWINANEHGVTLALLNFYPLDPQPVEGNRVSRGRLVRDLADAPEVAAVIDTLLAADLSPFDPFYLLAFGPFGPGVAFQWDTRCLRRIHTYSPIQFFTSSSLHSREVELARERQFLTLIDRDEPPTSDVIDQFHRSHDPAAPHASILMEREDAETVSYTRLRVTESSVFMQYHAKVPGQAAFEAPTTAVINRRGPMPTP